MKKNISNSRPFFQEAQILGSPDFAPKIYTQFQVKRIYIPWATHTVNPLLSPLSNKPYLIRGRRLMSPNSPSPYHYSLRNDVLYLFLLQDVRICFWSSAAWPTTIVLELFHFAVLVLYGGLIPSSLLNYVGPPPSNLFEINTPPGGGGLIEGLR